MATVEERVDKLEHDFDLFKGEAVTAYRDMAMELTMVKGLAEDSVRRLKGIETQVKNLDSQVGILNLRVGNLERRFDSLEQHFDLFEQGVNRRFETFEQNVNQRFETFEQNVNQRFETLEHRLDGHDGRFDRIEALLGQVLERLA